MRKTTFIAALLSVALLWGTFSSNAEAQRRWRRNGYYRGYHPAYRYRAYPYYGGYYRGYYAPYRYYSPGWAYSSPYNYGYPSYYGSYPSYYGSYPSYYGGGYVSTPWFSVGW